MTKKQSNGNHTKEQTEQIILEIIKNQSPENTQQLIRVIQEKTPLSTKAITEMLIQLEKEDKVHFNKKEIITTSLYAYAFSKQAAWYWITVALALGTVLTVFTIPNNSIPLVYIRSVLGLVFILFLPGFALVRVLYPSKSPFQTNNENLDNIIRIVLSIGLSIALVPIIGLILYYTSWGIGLAPITFSLLALTVVLATVAMLRKYQIELHHFLLAYPSLT